MLAIFGPPVQVAEGSVSDSDSFLYVAGRGLYEVLRSESCPPSSLNGLRASC